VSIINTRELRLKYCTLLTVVLVLLSVACFPSAHASTAICAYTQPAPLARGLRQVGARVAMTSEVMGGGEPGDEPPAGVTIYLRHLQLAVSTVMRDRKDLAELFCADEKALAVLFLPEQGSGVGEQGEIVGDKCLGSRGPLLSREARGLYTRMLQRKGPWFRLDSLIKYNELLSDWKEGGEISSSPPALSLFVVLQSIQCGR